MHYKKSLALFSILCLASCSLQNKTTEIKEEVNSKYLACYALDFAAKKQCTDQLAQQYILTRRKVPLKKILHS